MRVTEPFAPADLAELDERLLSRAAAVVSMREIHAGNRDPNVIGMRHDVDNGLAPALELARWESERGYRSTYFILHTAPYWIDEDALRDGLVQIEACGHEIGIHANALAEALRTGEDPRTLLEAAITRLRAWGFDVRGVAGHGDESCYRGGRVTFANDEQFAECARPELGAPERILQRGSTRLRLQPEPLAAFGLDYESLRLGRALYLSDSGGRWSPPFEQVIAAFPSERGQLHVLWHPDWWGAAFAEATDPVEAVA